jgi:DNA-binding response OmpR family regulator
VKGRLVTVTDKSGPTILNVDDNEAGRYATTRILQRAGYRVVEAGTGEQVLAQLEKNAIDLVIMDINLPDASGLELCSNMKADARYSHIPVLHLTATYVMSVDRLEESCADGYLMQPVEPAALLANIRALLRARQTELRLMTALATWQSGLDSLDEGLAVVDWGGTILQANRSFIETFQAAKTVPSSLRALVGRVRQSGETQTEVVPVGDLRLLAEACPVQAEADQPQKAIVAIRPAG